MSLSLARNLASLPRPFQRAIHSTSSLQATYGKRHTKFPAKAAKATRELELRQAEFAQLRDSAGPLPHANRLTRVEQQARTAPRLRPGPGPSSVRISYPH